MVIHKLNRNVIIKEEILKKKYSHELLSYADLDVIGDLIQLLKPFHELTVLISGSTYVTSSIVLPAVSRLMEFLKSYEASNGTKYLEDLAFAMYNDLKIRTRTYFDNKLLLAATYMDPRYRSLSFIKVESLRNRALFDASAFIKTLYMSYCHNTK